MAKDAKITAVYGRRGSGKSTLVQSLLKGRKRVVVFDPMAEFASQRGFVRVSCFRDLVAALRKGWGRGFKIAFVPDDDFKKVLHGISHVLWGAQAPYDAGRDDRKVTLVVEEMNLCYPPKDLPAGQEGFVRAILQGRHRGIEIIGVTQRPALVHPNFRSNAHDTYVFALEDHQDVQAIRRRVWMHVGDFDLRAIPEFSALHVVGTEVRQVTSKKP